VKAVDALARLHLLNAPVFTTADASALLPQSRATAAKTLQRLRESGLLLRLARGRWTFAAGIDPFAIPEYLAAPEPAYVSLHSALYHHGMISQIPSVVYAVTLGRARRIRTPLGTVSFHRVTPEFFFGFETVGRSGIKIATPEKALLDVLYLGTGRSRGLRTLPELELPSGFRRSVARNMVGRIRSPRRRRRVANRLSRVLAIASAAVDSGRRAHARRAVAGSPGAP
jgi:predicted transcriptional regulator of viral defense system